MCSPFFWFIIVYGYSKSKEYFTEGGAAIANPQVENGHIDIANEIAESLAGIRISGEEYQCLWVILRKTYGWHKKQDAISLSQFVEMTGIKKPNVIRAIKRLLSKKIITVINIDNAPATTYGINKDYSKWQSLSKKITLSKKIITVIKKDNASLSKKIPTKETTTKETITKEITPISPKRKNEKIELPEWLSQDLWEQFKEHRVFIKSKLSLKAEQINLNKLIELHNRGHDHKKLIEESIAHNWKSFYEPKNGNHPLTGKFSPNTIQTIENLQKFIERGKNEE